MLKPDFSLVALAAGVLAPGLVSLIVLHLALLVGTRALVSLAARAMASGASGRRPGRSAHFVEAAEDNRDLAMAFVVAGLTTAALGDTGPIDALEARAADATTRTIGFLVVFVAGRSRRCLAFAFVVAGLIPAALGLADPTNLLEALTADAMVTGTVGFLVVAAG